MKSKMSSAKCGPCCPGPIMLNAELADMPQRFNNQFYKVQKMKALV